MMTSLLATVGGEAADRLAGLGVQLAMVATVALFLGALRLMKVRGGKAPMVLAVGTLMLAIGVTMLVLEWTGVIELIYHPAWKEDYAAADAAMLDVMEEEDLYIPIPSWWEGPLWWGQRALRLVGMGM